MPAPPTKRAFLKLGLLGLLLGLFAGDLTGQEVPPPGGTGALSAALLIRQLDGVKRVLVIGAHPDDEDTSLLAALARGWGARAAYLALNRGEGGQNLIGPEMGEGLGIVRTGELLAARRVDGATQYFTRAYDFGYSKTAEETFEHWPRDSLLGDIVWVIRTFRPQIIVSVFSGTPADGHGQHQASGLLTREAFEAAGDPARFPEQLRMGAKPWTPLKLYRRTWRDPESSTIALETGRLDPVLGRSYHQLAMRSRSQHRSQDFGVAQLEGPRVTLFQLLESRVPGPDTSLFAGVDTTLVGLTMSLPPRSREAAERAIGRYREQLHAAAGELNALNPAAAVPALVRALGALEAAERTAVERTVAEPGAAHGELGLALGRRLTLLHEAILAAASVSLTVQAEDDVVVPGQDFWVRAKLWNGGPFPISAEAVELHVPAGWSVRADTSAAVDSARTSLAGFLSAMYPAAPPGAGPEGEADVAEVAPGALRTWGFRAQVSAGSAPSLPYYLRADRAGDMYAWPADSDVRALPADSPLLTGEVRLRLRVDTLGVDLVGVDSAAAARGQAAAVELSLERPARYRGVDKASGEYWRPVLVLPPVSVALEPRTIVWPTDRTRSRAVAVTLRAEAPAGFTGTVRLEVPRGWTSVPEVHEVRLAAPGAVRAYAFELQQTGPEGSDAAGQDAAGQGAAEPHAAGPAPEGSFPIRAVASDSAGRTFSQEAVLVDYPHIEPTLYLRDAVTLVRRLDVRVELGRRVGYVMGSGDGVPEGIRQLGLEVEMIGPPTLGAEELGRFDVIVLGVRAYEVRPDLAAANEALLDWVRDGGTLIVQYNKYEFPNGGFAPYPIAMHRPHDRVTDERSEVVLLESESPIFTRPNRITPRDFDDWVQERGLYLLSEWDERYAPVLEIADPDEEPKRGSLLIARVGKGLWVYTGLAFFRQLPAGVPGAYRLFANLLSLSSEEW